MTGTASAPDVALHIRCENLVRIHQRDRVEVVALQGLDLDVAAGEFVALVGASGSGKSTLLNILAGNDRPTAGRVTVAGQDLGALTRRQRLEHRRSACGFVQQQTARNLVPYLTAEQNVGLPLLATRTRRRARAQRSAELLALLGVEHCRDRTPAALSGGEQQRVALAVALANRPGLLLADEPTGELDSATSEEVFAALRLANEQLGCTVVLVTHDEHVASHSRRTVAIRDGRTSSETLLRTETDAVGTQRAVRDEYAVLDRVGRLQLPRAYTDALDMHRRVRLHLAEDHVAVWPQQAPDESGQR